MKKKIVSLLLSLLMLISLMPTVVLAAGSNISMTVTPSAHTLDTLRVGDTVTVTVVNNAMTVTSFVFNVKFDKDKFECKSIKGTGKNPDKYYLVDQYDDTVPSGTASTTAEANNSGTIGFGWAATSDANYKATTIVTITFEVKAVGSATFVLTEKSDGQDGFIGQVSTTPVTVSSAASNDLPVAIAKPATGGTPETTIDDTNYTGSITWTPEVTGGKFAANTEYTANVTLTAKGEYQFASNVKPIVAGADKVTVENVADDGKTLTFKAEFPETGDRTLKDIDIITKPELKLAVPKAAPNATATNERSLAVTGVYDDGSVGGPVAVNWEITTTPIPKGVSLVGSTLKVTNKAEAGKFTIKATSTEGGYTDIETVTITKEPAKETHIVATAPTDGTNITIPNVGTKTSGSCSYKFYDQYGAEMPGIGATWKVKLEPTTVTGVTLTTDGAIAVTNDATTCTATVYAEGSGVKSNEITFNIARAASVATSLTLNGSADSVTVPTVTEPGTTKCEYATYTATVKDQYGQEMPGETITWSITGNLGVTINNGQLIVTNKATDDDVTITAKSGALTATKNVTSTRIRQRSAS